MDNKWVTIGQIRKPHGIDGYVKVASLSDVQGRFTNLQQIWIEFPDGHCEAMTVEHCRENYRGPLLKLESIDDPEAAARLRGAYIQVHSTEAASLPEGQFYVFELIGSRVFMEDGEEIGTVREVLSMPANDVFVVDSSRGEVLIPAIHDVVTEIDLENRRMVIRPMPGLI